MSTMETTFEAWAPREAIWSPWVKPVLFAALDRARKESAAPEVVPPLEVIVPRADGTIAVVIDLPGASGLHFALGLAKLGYRPVPLYASAASFSGANETVDVEPIVRALAEHAPALSALSLKKNAPPAFVLDARRRDGAAMPGMFDNRTLSLPTDFPSARLLQEHGVRIVVLVQEKEGQPAPDLSHTLRAWQDDGLSIALATDRELERIKIEKPEWYRIFFYRFLALFGMKRSPLGGFGGFLPLPGSGVG